MKKEAKIEEPELIAVITPAIKPQGALPFKRFHDRIEAWRYYSVLTALRLYGASRMDAETTAKWISRKAKAGERREVYPGILIEIEEVKT